MSPVSVGASLAEIALACELSEYGAGVLMYWGYLAILALAKAVFCMLWQVFTRPSRGIFGLPGKHGLTVKIKSISPCKIGEQVLSFKTHSYFHTKPY